MLLTEIAPTIIVRPAVPSVPVTLCVPLVANAPYSIKAKFPVRAVVAYPVPGEVNVCELLDKNMAITSSFADEELTEVNVAKVDAELNCAKLDWSSGLVMAWAVNSAIPKAVATLPVVWNWTVLAPPDTLLDGT